MKRVTHYDLFAGIGGFSLALDNVFQNYERKHIFCEWEAFPTAILKKHWPDGTFYGDIHDLVADTSRSGTRMEKQSASTQGWNTSDQSKREMVRPGNREVDAEGITAGDKSFITTDTESKQGRWVQPKRFQPDTSAGSNITILTGGFPCQPFSHAGRRKGTADDRYLWPPMLEVIRNVRPDWVIAENVRGLVTWNEGMVLETVCADLESEGYEVQPLIIPAVAVGAPHRRDRVWIIAHSTGERCNDRTDNREERHLQKNKGTPEESQSERNGRERGAGEDSTVDALTPNTTSEQGGRIQQSEFQSDTRAVNEWNKDWREVAAATCHDRVDDGLPRWMDGTTISSAKHRKERLKACGNAIVPQVAEKIFEAIKQTL